MRLPTLLAIGLASLGASALSAPALAGPDHDGPMPHMDGPPPMDMHRDRHDLPPPVHRGPDGPHGYPGHPGYGAPWHHPGGPVPGPWMPPCVDHPEPAAAPGCMPYGYYPAYPAMTYAVPMMMVPVLRQKPCAEEVVEEWIEEERVPVRRRTIAPRPTKEKRVKVVPDKRVKEKRVAD
jgi:hypothetical protein